MAARLKKLSSDDIHIPDGTLVQLLELDGTIMEVGGGYWIRIKAVRVPPSAARPHGIDYSLCLFDPRDTRVLGYDNAHPAAAGTGTARRRGTRHDHRHAGRIVRPYAYVDAASLLDDFWNDVDDHLSKAGIP